MSHLAFLMSNGSRHTYSNAIVEMFVKSYIPFGFFFLLGVWAIYYAGIYVFIHNSRTLDCFVSTGFFVIDGDNSDVLQIMLEFQEYYI